MRNRELAVLFLQGWIGGQGGSGKTSGGVTTGGVTTLKAAMTRGDAAPRLDAATGASDIRALGQPSCQPPTEIEDWTIAVVCHGGS